MMTDYNEFQALYEGESDRSVAILASSYLDSYIGEFLKKRLVPHKCTKSLFGGYAPLSTFSAKIDFSFAIGLIPEHVRKDLHAIRKIRNLFAHEAEKIDFTSERIISLCGNFSTSQGLPRTDGSFREMNSEARSKYLHSVWYSLLHMEGESTRIVQLKTPSYRWKEVVEDD